MSRVSALQNSSNLISRATREDRRKNFSEALKLYEYGIESLIYSLGYEARSESDKRILRFKCLQYLERAEKLKNFLKRTTAPRAVGSGSDPMDDDRKKMFSMLEDAIVVESSLDVRWEDVAGCDAAKEAIKEAVVMPIKFPYMFTGSRKPWKGILLFGPPGTGKSHLAKAVASETPNSTFFAVSSSDLVSKWLGESEKLVRSLFELARMQAPSIIFIDEVDSLCSARSESDSESARRIKTELLVQMQGVGHDLEGVLVLAATNMPWLLDAAVRRRFEKRIYIPLPETPARALLFRNHLRGVRHTLAERDWVDFAARTEGFSGADINLVTRDSLMEPIRRLQTATHFKLARGPSCADLEVIRDDMLTPCSPGDPDAIEMALWEVSEERLFEPPVVLNDVLRAITNTKPSVRQEDLGKLDKFCAEFGIEG